MGMTISPAGSDRFRIEDAPDGREPQPSAFNLVLELSPETARSILRLCDLMSDAAFTEAALPLEPHDPPSLRMSFKHTVFRKGDREDLSAARFEEGSFIEIEDGGARVILEGWFQDAVQDWMTVKAEVSREELKACLDPAAVPSA